MAKNRRLRHLDVDFDDLFGPDDLAEVPLPRVRLAAEEDLVSSAQAASVVDGLVRFVAWVGDGRPATLDDPALAEVVAPDAVDDVEADDIALCARWAVAARLVVVTDDDRFVATPQGSDAGDDLLGCWFAAATAWFSAGALDDEDVPLAAASTDAGLDVRRLAACRRFYEGAALGAAVDGSMFLAELDARLGEIAGPVPYDAEDEVISALADHLARLGAALEALGMVDVGYVHAPHGHDGHDSHDGHDHDDFADVDAEAEGEAVGVSLRLTPLGTWGLQRLFLAAGFAAPVAGEFRDQPAEVLLAGVASLRGDDAMAECHDWLLCAPDDPAVTQERAAALAAAAIAVVPPLTAVGRHVVLGALDRLGAHDADAAIGGLEALRASEPFMPAATLMLVDFGVLDSSAAADVDAVGVVCDEAAFLLEVGGPEAVVDAFDDGAHDDAEQIDLVAAFAARGGAEVIAVLDALASAHPSRKVAKAARTALHRLRSRAN